MEKIILPKIVEEKISDNRSKFIIEPLHPGYGATFGNPLRRVLLSSITGAAATSFKIEGVSHEFSSIPHAKEDVIELMMNLKEIHIKSYSEEPVVLEISKKGPAEVTAKDFRPNSSVEIANPDAHIITLDKGADFYMEVVIEKDRGFHSVNVGLSEKSELGRIGIDAMFSPVERCSITVEDTRVGQMTNYDKLILDITTNGTITPNDALKEASQVLVEHYTSFVNRDGESNEAIPSLTIASDEVDDAVDEMATEASDIVIDNKTKLEDLNFSARTFNALSNSGIKTVGGLRKLSQLKLEEIKGLGKKGIDEINAFLN